MSIQRALRQGLVFIGTAAVGLAGLSDAAGASTTRHLSPGQSLSSLLAASQPGDTVILRNGYHPRQFVSSRFSATVRIVGESRTGAVLQGLELANGASNLAFSDLTVRTPGPSDPNGAIKVYGGANRIVFERLNLEPLSQGGLSVHNWGGAPSDIVLRNSVVNGARSSGTWNARAVYVGDVTGADSSGWPKRISVTGNDLGYFWSDIVHVAGATDMTVSGNRIHDVLHTNDHNDGIQSVASLRLRIVGNEITSPADPTATTIPPDQAIILGHATPSTAYKKVVDTYVANNLIHHWRGKAVLLHGTESTSIVNNTVAMSGPLTDPLAAPSLTVYGPAGAPQNNGAKIWNNVLDRLWVDAAVKPAYVGANCIRMGGTSSDVQSNPLFVDTIGFALSAISPCINIGINAWETPPTDRLGNPRIGAPDAGARERTVF